MNILNKKIKREIRLTELEYKLDRMNKKLKDIEEDFDINPFKKYIKYLKVFKARNKLKEFISEVSYDVKGSK